MDLWKQLESTPETLTLAARMIYEPKRLFMGTAQTNPKDNVDDNKVVIAFGGAVFRAGVGCRSGPLKSFYNALYHRAIHDSNVYSLKGNEYLTSQVCNSCQTRTLEKKKNAIGAVLQCTLGLNNWKRLVRKIIDIASRRHLQAGGTYPKFERLLKLNKARWLPLSDYRLKECKTKLFEGLGLSEDSKMAIFIESSGQEQLSLSLLMAVANNLAFVRNSKNVNHRVEDSFKNMKNCTDFLKHLSCVYKQANIKTFQLLKIPCINVIFNRMTLCLCSISEKPRFRIDFAMLLLEKTIALPAAESAHFVKVFDLFALLKEINENNDNAIHNLELENLGVSDAHYTTVDQYSSNIHHSIIP